MMSNRTTKTEQEKRKLEQEKLQAVLCGLLKEDDNKYCVDCDSKVPRWASWNLGVFLCIKCAGIHRNLGVHLSKVKSINLDSWTPEQVQSMRVMGNSKSRGVYECHLPDHFRRPLSDQSLESFIRAKYEHKRYFMKDWQPPRVDVKDLPCWEEIQDIRHGRTNRSTGNKSTSNGQSRSPIPNVTSPQTRPSNAPIVRTQTTKTEKQPPHKPSAINDLVDLSIDSSPALAPQPSVASALDDLLGLGQSSNPGNMESAPQPPDAPDLMFGEFYQSTPAVEHISGLNQAGERKSTADILALYGSNAGSQTGTPVNQMPTGYEFRGQQPQMYNPMGYGQMPMYQGQMPYGYQQQQINMAQAQMANMNLIQGTQPNTLATNLWQ